MLPRVFLKNLAPYFLLTIIAVIAYLPVSTMTYALKNDIIGLEYPIKFFISDAIRNQSGAFWFNTWALGFPLESIITWSPFSPPGFLFAALTKYNLYTLHVEFVFYIALAGCSMFQLLQKHFAGDKRTTLLLSVAYMLSGFCVGSSQWLLYITAASFIPFCLGMLLTLFANPNWRTALLFSVSFYIMLTSVYLAFSIITVYILLSIGLYHSYRQFRTNKEHFWKIARFASLSILFILVISLPCLLSTFQLLQYINRGNPIAADQHFFQSNYLHPFGLLSLLSPLPVVRFNTAGTEGSMMNSYTGLLAMLLFPATLARAFYSRDRKSLLLFLVSLFFLLASLGHLTPVRGLMNVLPGFSYFRNAGLIRLFFILFTILFLAHSFRHGLPTSSDKTFRKIVTFTAITISLIFIFFLIKHINTINTGLVSVKAAVAGMNIKTSLALSALIQLPLLWAMFICWRKNKYQLLSTLAVSDLVVNTLICLPFFTVSSYSVKQVSDILKIAPGDPVQTIFPSQVPTSFKSGDAIWFNSNVYPKQVSTQPSYWGPLVLKSFKYEDSLLMAEAKPLLYDSLSNQNILSLQKPNHVVANVHTEQPTTIHFLQNWYPGWHAYLNKNEINIDTSSGVGMKLKIEGSGLLEFSYEKRWLAITAVTINMIVILTLLLAVALPSAFLNLKISRAGISVNNQVES